jgi:hypothetical protein
MPKRRILRPEDFGAEGEPYSEVVVKICIRILGRGITRSRLAVNIYPDRALDFLAVRGLKPDQFGENESGEFVVCLSEHVNGWHDMNEEFPKIDTRLPNVARREDAESMNKLIQRSVDWILSLHHKAMTMAGISEASE